jgi:hypothetical protein
MMEKSSDNEETGKVGGVVRFTEELVVGRWNLEDATERRTIRASAR